MTVWDMSKIQNFIMVLLQYCWST